jgi:alpha-glucosidase
MNERPTPTGFHRQLAGDPHWWRGGVIYQVYPRSFLDTNGDGIGDLNGITEKLPYIASLNVDAVWISPHFVSPMDDFGYDVADYRDVDPIFGTLADFDRLLEEAHRLGLRVLIDLVLSHTSDRHPWFIESRADRTNPKADWYVWADPKPDGTAPNNWLSVFGGPAWEWDTRRRQYYMHNFLASQPDLNFHNEEVQEAVLDVARFWLDKGVDGFRLDTANKYHHDTELRDNPPIKPGEHVIGMPLSNPLSMQAPIYSVNRPETPIFHERLRALMDEYPATMAVGEIGARLEGSGALAEYTKPGRLHMAYSFDLLGERSEAAHIRTIVEQAEKTGASWSSWPFSNHDVPRVVTRFRHGADAGAMLLQLLTCLRGTPSLYQGEELALTESDIAFEHLQDPYGRRFWPLFKGRDGCRTPMPWLSDAPNAGFSSSRPWLPIDPQHYAVAVDVQEKNPDSPLNRARAFLAWRREHKVFRDGTIRFHDAPEPVLAFTRADEEEALLCVFNLSNVPQVFEAPGDVRTADAPGLHGGSAEGRTVRLDSYGAFIGAIDEGRS